LHFQPELKPTKDMNTTNNNNSHASETKETLLKEIKRLKLSLKNQKYGLIWMDIPEGFEKESENKLPVLKEQEKFGITNKDNKPSHILIEGDNYHALTCLNYTHKGKVDLIYIDPPYNTGSDGFRYKDKRIIDKFPDGTEVPIDHPFRHSYWLSFMGKRLELAKDLLKETGTIFVSIDDNEHSQLKLLLDKIFNQSNLIADVVVQSNPRGKQQMKIANTHEYVLVYAKNIDKVEFSGSELSDKQIKEYSKIDKNGHYRENGLRKRGAAARRVDVPNLYYPIFVDPKTSNVSLTEDNNYKENALPILSNGEDGRWRWGTKKFQKYNDRLFGRLVNNSRWDIFEKDYLIKEGDQKKTKSKSVWIEKELNYENAKDELKLLFNGKAPFDYPKTTYLIKKILKLIGNNNAIVLDFFAVSGTTAHAVLQQNEDDEGDRQFILVTNNEENIMTDICYPRIKKIINGYDANARVKNILFEEEISLSLLRKSEEVLIEIDEIKEKNKSKWDDIKIELENEKLRLIGERFKKTKIKGLGNSIKFYKTSFIGQNNIKNYSDEDRIELSQNAGELLSIAENTLYLKEKNNYWQIFEEKNRFTGIYFREELNKFDAFIKRSSSLEGKKVVYIFSWGNEEFSDYFEDMKDIEVKSIPQPILEIYKQINNSE